MKRAEYNEYLYIRFSLRKSEPGYGSVLTIRTDASPEYKHKLHELYTGLGYHPASVRVDTHFFDEKMRIHYIFGQKWEDNDGHKHPWTELYTPDERARFASALD